MSKDNFRRLNFPRQYEFDVRVQDGATVILDPLRRKYVAFTPEEWVRQNLIQFLIHDRGCPGGLTAVEKGFKYGKKQFRADVVVHDRQGRAVLIAECKEPSVPVGRDTFEQIANYNRVIRARYLFVTNGLTHYCCVLDLGKGTYDFLEELPRYEEM